MVMWRGSVIYTVVLFLSKYSDHFLSTRCFVPKLTGYCLWYLTDFDVLHCEDLGLLGHETVLGEWFLTF